MLDALQVRDRSLTPCTLLDAAEADPPITKNVVYLEITRDDAGQRKERAPEVAPIIHCPPPKKCNHLSQNSHLAQEECSLDVLKLVGNLLASKMSLQNSITHRALIIISKTKDAEARQPESNQNIEPEQLCKRPCHYQIALSF